MDTNQVIHRIGVDFKTNIWHHLKVASYLVHQVMGIYCNFDKVQTFAGGDERSSRDGTPIYLRFYTPTGIAVRNDSSNF